MALADALEIAIGVPVSPYVIAALARARAARTDREAALEAVVLVRVLQMDASPAAGRVLRQLAMSLDDLMEGRAGFTRHSHVSAGTLQAVRTPENG